MNAPQTSTPVIEFKPYTSKELARIYGVERRTLNRWLAPFSNDVGPKTGRFYTIAQVRTIFNRLGLPGIAPDS